MFVLINGEEIIPVVEAGEELKLAVGEAGGGWIGALLKTARAGEVREGRVLAGEAAQLASVAVCEGSGPYTTQTLNPGHTTADDNSI